MGDAGDILITRAVPGDGEAILAVQRLAFAPAAERYSIPDLPPLIEQAEVVERAIADDTVLVAREESGTIVGSVRGEERDGCVYVGRLTVRPDFQRRGLATRLMEALEERFPHAECFELFTGNMNEPGMGLYLKLGYREQRRRRVSELLEVVYMAKPGPGAGRSGKHAADAAGSLDGGASD